MDKTHDSPVLWYENSVGIPTEFSVGMELVWGLKFSSQGSPGRSTDPRAEPMIGRVDIQHTQSSLSSSYRRWRRPRKIYLYAQQTRTFFFRGGGEGGRRDAEMRNRKMQHWKM